MLSAASPVGELGGAPRQLLLPLSNLLIFTGSPRFARASFTGDTLGIDTPMTASERGSGVASLCGVTPPDPCFLAYEGDSVSSRHFGASVRPSSWY